MKKSVLSIICGLALLMLGVCGRSSDEKSLEYGEMVQIWDTYSAPYHPIQADKAPEWLQRMMAYDDLLYFVVFRGYGEKGTIYNVHSLFDNVASGSFVDENGEYLIPSSEKYFEEATGWECIFYRDGV